MGKQEALSELNRFMADIWADLERDRRATIARKAEADPKAYKMSKVLKSTSRNGGDGAHTSHWGGQDKRARYFYCVADHVNVAGYILTWRETWYRKPYGKGRITMKRDQWAAKKTHAAAVRLAKARAARHLSRLAA